MPDNTLYQILFKKYRIVGSGEQGETIHNLRVNQIVKNRFGITLNPLSIG
jgi:hypothetical protein